MMARILALAGCLCWLGFVLIHVPAWERGVSEDPNPYPGLSIVIIGAVLLLAALLVRRISN
jgi:hypothetical protein